MPGEFLTNTERFQQMKTKMKNLGINVQFAQPDEDPVVDFRTVVVRRLDDIDTIEAKARVVWEKIQQVKLELTEPINPDALLFYQIWNQP